MEQLEDLVFVYVTYDKFYSYDMASRQFVKHDANRVTNYKDLSEACRELRETGQNLRDVSIKLEKMAILIESKHPWWGDM